MSTRGGKREGAGRKPGSGAQIEVRAAIETALQSKGPDTLQNIWQKVIEKAEAGSDKHIQILLNYYYGKPVDNVNLQGGMILNFTRKIVK